MTQTTQHLVPESLYTPSRLAVLFGDQSFSYGQIFNAALKAKATFVNCGIQPGDRVSLVSPSTPSYIVSLLALWHIGAVACPVNTCAPQNLMDTQLEAINSRYCITISKMSHISDVKVINMPNILIDEDGGENLDYSIERDATIIFTSGSSSKPKAALHTLSNHFYSAKGSNEHIPVIPGDQWLLSLPLYHVGGLSILFRTFLGGGSIVILQPEGSIERALEQHSITHLSLVPTQLIRLLRNKGNLTHLKSLKAILLGGGPIPRSLIQESLDVGLPIYSTYGLTEMASQVATSRRLTKESSLSARMLNYRRLMISQEEEIFVKGETLFKGYIDGEKLSMPFNANGYFATGDLGQFSDDGNLIVTGRKDNMFISGGENIQPEEIEKHLCELEEIEEAVVIPVVHEEFGFRPVAFIKTSRQLSGGDVLTFLEDRLPSFKLPDQFYQWPDADTREELKMNRNDLARLLQKEEATGL